MMQRPRDSKSTQTTENYSHNEEKKFNILQIKLYTDMQHHKSMVIKLQFAVFKNITSSNDSENF
jgi:hypothetical protein